MLKNPSEKFLGPDPETDDFQNLMECFFSKDRSVNLLQNFHADPISYFYVKLLKDEQTNKHWVLHNLLGRADDKTETKSHNKK